MNVFIFKGLQWLEQKEAENKTEFRKTSHWQLKTLTILLNLEKHSVNLNKNQVELLGIKRSTKHKFIKMLTGLISVQCTFWHFTTDQAK